MELNPFLESLLALGGTTLSDLHFKVGSPPLLRIQGTLESSGLNTLGPEDTSEIATALAGGKNLDGVNEFDAAYSIPGKARFRVNIFRQQGQLSIVMRVISSVIPTLESLNLPQVIQTIASEERGLVLVTGPTGSGKSTTLAAMIDYVNKREKLHIITVEDPIEYLHTDRMSSINQREVGHDTDGFTIALRAALRQDPDIILVGEMRDTETISIAIKAAETGHLVFSTLHTVDAAKTINRIVDSFPGEQQGQIRLQLAANLKAIISQRLLPKKDGGRIAALEIMRTTSTIQGYIEQPEKTALIRDAIMDGQSQYGMQIFDHHLKALYLAGEITLEVATAASSSPNDFQRSLVFH